MRCTRKAASTYVLVLHKEVDGGQVLRRLRLDNLRLELRDPAVDVVAALLVQHGTLVLEQLVGLLRGGGLQLVPLRGEGGKDRGDLLPRLRLVRHQLLTSLQQSTHTCLIHSRPRIIYPTY